MMLKHRQVLRVYRWMVVACAFVGLLVLAQASAAAVHQQPTVGLRAAASGDQMSVTWVQPAGFAWDKNVRPGDIVTEIDGNRVDRHTQPGVLATAFEVSVRSRSDGQPISVTATPAGEAHQISIDRRGAFLTLATCFIVVGAAIYVLSVELATGHVVLSLSLAGATALIAAIATPSRATWALTVEHVAVTIFCASVFLLFLVFPINRLFVVWGRVAAAICLGVTLTLLCLYAWVLAANSAAFGWLEKLAFAVLAADFVGAAGVAVYALVQRSAKKREVRPALALIVLGILAGLAPFYLLAIAPRMFGRSVWHHLPVQPEYAILSVVLLPIGLGAAVLSRQFPGITHLVRRGLVALVVWTMLVTAYTIGLYGLFQWLEASQTLEPTLPLTALIVAFIGATFTPSQSWLRRAIERMLFHDVYNYAETLERLSNEIARLSTIDAIAWHVLRSLAKMLDLSWAAIAMSSPGTPRLVYPWGDCPEGLTHPTEDDVLSPHVGGTHTHMTKTVEEHDALLVPLVAEEASLGLLAIGPKRGDMEHLPEDKALIATLAPLVTTALHNALLTQSLQQQVATLAERECALAALTERLLQAHEEERRRIALDLHDDPLQRAILLTREMSEIAGETLPSHARRSAEEIAISLRAICTGLRPPMLDDLGLVASLEWLASDISARSDLTASLMVDGFESVECTRLEANLEVALYRVAQEALTNCVKHARASHVWVTLQRESDMVRLRVIDDGQGWNSTAENTDRGPHLGLLGMRERLRPWGGTVQIGANPAGGTLVSADVRLRGDND